MERKLAFKRRETFLSYIKKNFSPRIVYIEGETVDDVGPEVEADSSVKGVTKQIIQTVRDLTGGGPPGPDGASEFSHGGTPQRASDVHTELRMELEEQEIMLRKTIKKLEMSAS